MLDPSAAASKTKGPRLDLHQHLAELEAAGLLVRIDLIATFEILHRATSRAVSGHAASSAHGN